MKGKTMSDNTSHPSYTPPAIADSMPSEFSYLRPGGVNGGFTGQDRVGRYGDEDDDSDDD
jgi:hypothetical protein